MKHVQNFVKTIIESEQLSSYGSVRIFLDEDFTCTEHFSALGNLYFIHNSLKNIKIFDFKENVFQPVTGKEIFSGNIEDVPFKEKAKFPQKLFPECKWSRKGFMRTRWAFEECIFDLINIHLFHDASNFIAMESVSYCLWLGCTLFSLQLIFRIINSHFYFKFPSQYTIIRQNALKHALDKFSSDQYANVPLFVFGDFNFRLDTKAVIDVSIRVSDSFVMIIIILIVCAIVD